MHGGLAPRHGKRRRSEGCSFGGIARDVPPGALQLGAAAIGVVGAAAAGALGGGRDEILGGTTHHEGGDLGATLGGGTDVDDLESWLLVVGRLELRTAAEGIIGATGRVAFGFG